MSYLSTERVPLEAHREMGRVSHLAIRAACDASDHRARRSQKWMHWCSDPLAGRELPTIAIAIPDSISPRDETAICPRADPPRMAST